MVPAQFAAGSAGFRGSGCWTSWQSLCEASIQWGKGLSIRPHLRATCRMGDGAHCGLSRPKNPSGPLASCASDLTGGCDPSAW